jgi:hypothetical protein
MHGVRAWVRACVACACACVRAVQWEGVRMHARARNVRACRGGCEGACRASECACVRRCWQSFLHLREADCCEEWRL